MDIRHLSDQFALSNTADDRLADSEQKETVSLLPSPNLFSSDPNRSLPSCPTTFAILDNFPSDRFSSHRTECLPFDTTVCHCPVTRINHVCHRFVYDWEYVVHEFILLQLSSDALQIRGLCLLTDLHVAQVGLESRLI